ncbi:MAG: ParA family protein, partial [Sarcina sp.]
DLLPSSIDLIDMMEDIIKIDNEKKKIEILDKELEKVKKDYDYILIDCPPDLSSITMTGLYSSEKYIIPIIPDPLSVYGLNQLIKKIENKVRVIKRTKSNYNCVPIGIIVNRYTGTQAQRNIKESLEAREGKDLPKIFKSHIKALDKIGRLSEEVQGKTTIKEKYKNGYNDLENLVKEIIDEV